MKIALILAADKRDPLIKSDPFMPLSLPILAASAPEHEYTLINMLSGDRVNFNKTYDVVGISARLTAEKIAYKVADEFRKRNIPVILGGPQMSSVPYRAKEHGDAVAVGEGELTWPVILDDIKNKCLKDFYVCSPVPFDAKGHTVHQIDSYVDLGTVKVPARRLYKHRYSFDTVYAARGCPIDCDFCSVSHLFGKKIRTRPIDDVVNEINTFKNFYYLLDDTVFGRPSNYDYYMKLYERIAGLKKKRFWTGQANLDAAATKEGREVIKMAAKSGFLYAAIGMESINTKILEKSGVINKVGAADKKDVIARMKEHIKFIQDQGVIISGWFTIGYEEDTIDTYYETLEFCKQNNIIPIISPLEAIPGTRLFDRLISENRVDYTKKINIVHPVMEDDDAVKAWATVNTKGFTYGEILRRTAYYAKLFDKHNTNPHSKVFNKIYKTIFSLVLQLKVRQGVMGFANEF